MYIWLKSQSAAIIVFGQNHSYLLAACASSERPRVRAATTTAGLQLRLPFMALLAGIAETSVYAYMGKIRRVRVALSFWALIGWI